MGSGDSKAELATVELAVSIVFLCRSQGGGLGEREPHAGRNTSLPPRLKL